VGPRARDVILSEWEPFSKVDQKRMPYVAEYEVATDTRSDGGHYDFEFTNPEGQPLEVGLETKGCQCSRVTVCVLSESDWGRYLGRKRQQPDAVARSRENPDDGFTWKELIPKDHKGAVVPPRGSGVVRLFWEGRAKREPKREMLELQIWVSPPGKYSQRALIPLAVPVQYVEPVRFHPKDLDVGTLSPEVREKSASLYCWSATRRLKVRGESSDARFAVKIQELDEPGCARLTEELRAEKILTRVRSAYRVDVTVSEEKGGKRLDLGTFHRSLPLEISGDGEALPVAPPVVRGRVQGDIRVGGLEDKGHILLKPFRTDFGVTKAVDLWAKPGLELKADGSEPADLGLKVSKLEKRPEGGEKDWAVWRVEVTVPPGLQPGPLPEEAAVVLRIQGEERRVRIPVRGTVLRGGGL